MEKKMMMNDKDMLDHQKIRMKGMEKRNQEAMKNKMSGGMMKNMVGKDHSEVRKMMEE